MEGKGLGHSHKAVCRLHYGVRTNHSTVFNHILPEIGDSSKNSKFQFEWRVNLKLEK